MSEGAPSETEVRSTVRRLIGERLPPGWSVASGRGMPSSLRLVAPDGAAVTFAVTIRRARQIEAVLDSLAEADGPQLFLAPFLSPTLRAALSRRSISYADTTGNLRIMADRPGLFIRTQGARRDPWPTDDTLRSLRGRAAARAVRALVDHRPPYGVRDLSKRATVPLGSLSRTLDLLDREGLVHRGPRGDVADLNWEGALRRWSDDYEFLRSNRVAGCVGASGLDARLARVRWQYALSGAAVAHRLAGARCPRSVSLYVEDLDLAAERLGLRVVDTEPEVVLAEPYGAVVFERTMTADDLRVVAPSQAAADALTNGDGGEELLAWMRRNEATWRI